MRIHEQNKAGFIRALAASIDKNPASLEYWKLVHLSNEEDVSGDRLHEKIGQWKTNYSERDFDMILCPDQDVLLLSTTMEEQTLSTLAQELREAIAAGKSGKGEVIVYDMFRDWRAVSTLLNAKAPALEPIGSTNASYDFGETESLSEVFREARKLRSARLPLHIMVVEDDPLTRRLVSSAFKEKYAIISAENAREAVASYLLYAPDIVFLDINLPDASGFDVLHQILQQDQDAYVVMFSGNGYLENITHALEAGASGFVSKPFRRQKMYHYIEDSALHHRHH